jgi:hypothetical protein
MSAKPRNNLGVHTIAEFFEFFLVSLSTACLGWGMVVIASRKSAIAIMADQRAAAKASAVTGALEKR